MKRVTLKPFMAALMLSLLALILVGCRQGAAIAPPTPEPPVAPDEVELVITGSMQLLYAQNYMVEYAEGGYRLITFSDEQRFLTVPEGVAVPSNLDGDILIIQLPLDNLYLASSPAMSFIDRIGGLDSISMTSMESREWYIENVAAKMEAGEILFVGTQLAPDYELIAATPPALAIHNSMLFSLPEVAEQFAALEIPVMIELSSEAHPLARVEWMRLYGVLLGLEAEAEAAFAEQVQAVRDLDATESSAKSVAIFYINTAGNLYGRNAGDYVVEMVRLAGGEYILPDLRPEASGNSQMEPEAFYDAAREAEVIIYIFSLGGRPENMQALIDRNEILSDIKAISDGEVWCTADNFFQVADSLGFMVRDIHTVLNNTDPELDQLDYLFRLR